MATTQEAGSPGAAADREARAGWVVWMGWAVSAAPVAMLLVSAAMKLARPSAVLPFFVGKFGYPGETLAVIGVVEAACAILYAVPRTAALGAVLVAGYLGGAIATHVRIGEPFLPPLLLGIAAWAGLWLRDERVRALVPLRR